MDKFLKYYFGTSQLFSHFPCHFGIEPGARVLITQKKSRRHLFWILNCAFNTLYSSFLTHFLLLNVSVYLARKAYVFMILHAFWIFGIIYMLVNQCPHILFGKQVISLIQAVNMFMTKLETNKFQNANLYKASDKFRGQQMGILVMYAVAANILVMCPMYAVFMDKGNWQMGSYVYKLVVSMTGQHPVSRTFAIGFGVLIDFWHMNGIQAVTMFNLLVNLIYMNMFQSTVQHISKKRQQLGLTLKNMEDDLNIYASLRILTRMFNSTFGRSYISPIQTLMSICVVIGAVVVMSLHGDKENILVLILGLTCALCSLVVLICFVIFMAKVNHYSELLRMSITARDTKLRNKIAKRMLKAYKVEAIVSGGFFEIKNITCLTLLGFLSNVTGSALISLKF